MTGVGRLMISMPGPVQPDHDFDIEVHARAEFLPPVEVNEEPAADRRESRTSNL